MLIAPARRAVPLSAEGGRSNDRSKKRSVACQKSRAKTLRKRSDQ